jgi:GNAT superfamily N-acetyltransferase
LAPPGGTIHEASLGRDADGAPQPELAMAVTEGARGKGIGTALVEAVAAQASERFDALTLNVHLRNPAVRLYIRTGFEVAGHGRGRTA